MVQRIHCLFLPLNNWSLENFLFPTKLRKSERACDLFQRKKKSLEWCLPTPACPWEIFAGSQRIRRKCDNALWGFFPAMICGHPHWNQLRNFGVWRQRASQTSKAWLGATPKVETRLLRACLGPFRRQEEISVDQARGHNSRPQLSWGWVHVNPLAFGGEIQSGG